MSVIMAADGKACLKSNREVSVSVPGAVLRQRRSAWGLSVFPKEWCPRHLHAARQSSRGVLCFVSCPRTKEGE